MSSNDLVPPEAPLDTNTTVNPKKDKKGIFSFLKRKSKINSENTKQTPETEREDINNDMEKFRYELAKEEEKDLISPEIPEFSEFNAQEVEQPKKEEESLIAYKDENFGKEANNFIIKKGQKEDVIEEKEPNINIPIPKIKKSNISQSKKTEKNNEKPIIKIQKLLKIPQTIKNESEQKFRAKQKENKKATKESLSVKKEKQKVIREKIPEDKFSTKIEREAIAHFKKLEQDHKIAADQLRQAINDAKKLEEIKPENYFYLRTGTPIRSLKELSDVLKFMSEQDFKYHVNDKKNDFANWIRDILKKRVLAEKIRNAVAKKELISILEEHESKIKIDISKYKKIIENIEKKRRAELNNMIEQKIALCKLQEKIDKKNKIIIELEKELKEREADLNKREADIIKKEKNLERVYKTKTRQQIEKLNKMQNILIKDKEKLEKAKKEYEERYNAAKLNIENAEKEKKKIEIKKKELNEKENSINYREQELKKKENLLIKREEEIKKQIDDEKKMRKELEYTRQRIETEKDHLESAEFKKYIEEELKSSDNTSLNEISNISGDLRPKSRSDNEIINLIDQCRKVLQRGNLVEAQKMYNDIRTMFLGLQLEKDEKEELYNLLRELYDDIKLEIINK